MYICIELSLYVTTHTTNINNKSYCTPAAVVAREKYASVLCR